MTAPAKLGAPEAGAAAAGSSLDGDEVSIVVAFRGTSSWQNMFTDARISMRPLARQAAAAAAATADYSAFDDGDGEGRRWWRPRWPRWVRAQRSLQPLSAGAVPFDLELQVGEELRRSRSSDALAAEMGPLAAGPSEHLGQPLTAAAEAEAPSARSCLARCCFRCTWWLCRLLGRFCILLCFPFLPPSDFEEDDEEFAAATLARVRVHVGFSQAYASVREDVKSLLQERLDCCAAEGRTVHIYVTGHSLGGAIASLFALDLSGMPVASQVNPFAESDPSDGNPFSDWNPAADNNPFSDYNPSDGNPTSTSASATNPFSDPNPFATPPDDNPFSSLADINPIAENPPSDNNPFSAGAAQNQAPVVYTFGSPRLGNAAFRSIYNALVPYTFRLVASRDLVPTLPPSITYRQLGREVWLDDAGQVTFVMSWAMRHILPARDSIRCHPMLAYHRLLGRAFRRKWGHDFLSGFRHEVSLRDTLRPG